MRIEQFRFFLEIAQTQSIRIAAENLYISQPAVSRSIRSLEDELGVQLFTRTVEGAFLTDSGKKLYPEIKEFVARISDLQAHAHALAIEEVKRNDIIQMKILTFSTLVDTLFLSAIDLFQEQYPFIQPILKNFKLHSFSERLFLNAQNDIDLVVVTDINDILSPVFVVPSWKKEILFFEEYVAIVDEAHPLSSTKEITLKEACDYQLIVPQNGLPIEELFFSLTKNEVQPSIFMQSNNVATILPALQQNRSVLLTTSTLAQKDFAKLPRIKMLPIKQVKGVCFALYDPENLHCSVIKDMLNYLKYCRFK